MHELLAAASKWLVELVRDSHAVESAYIEYCTGLCGGDPYFKAFLARTDCRVGEELDILIYDWPDWETAKTMAEEKVREWEEQL